jgi:hypothetical protein
VLALSLAFKCRIVACLANLAVMVATHAVEAQRMPSLQDLSAALEATHRPAKPLPAIDSVEGCYPTNIDPPSIVICVINFAHGRREETIYLRSVGGLWRYFKEASSSWPVCPRKLEATKLIRKFPFFERLTVVNAPHEGILTNQRGRMRDRSGPMRLGCTYEMSSESANLTVMAYFRYVDGHYEIDEYDELLPN